MRDAAWTQVVDSVPKQAGKVSNRRSEPPRTLSPSMHSQFECHTIAGALKFPTWNLDAWRPNESLAGELLHACNPPEGSAVKVVEHYTS